MSLGRMEETLDTRDVVAAGGEEEKSTSGLVAV